MMEKVKYFFSGLFKNNYTTTSNINSARRVSSKLVEYIVNESDFNNMTLFEVFENMYEKEPEVGGAIDRISTLVGQSFKGFSVKNDSKLHNAMLEDAQKIAKADNFDDIFEMGAELLSTYGNLFIKLDEDNINYTILPNKYISVIDDRDMAGRTDIDRLITEPNFYIYNEEKTDSMKVYDSKDIMHIKYKKTPIYFKDVMNRQSFGIYSISPLQRAIVPVWWKRQTMIIDVLWRWRNVPREHHKIDSGLFNYTKYEGSTIEAKKRNAESDASAKINNYIENLVENTPDQGYVTLDNTDITSVSPSGSNYMDVNGLMEQINDEIWTALNVSQSMVNGKNSGSYAGEVMVGNYISSKIEQIGEKISELPMWIVKRKLLEINEDYPVNDLECKIEMTLSSNKLETFRIASIMGKLGIFTINEIRDTLGYNNMKDGNSIVNSKGIDVEVENAMRGDEEPQTSWSDAQHTRDDGENDIRNMESDSVE